MKQGLLIWFIVLFTGCNNFNSTITKQMNSGVHAHQLKTKSNNIKIVNNKLNNLNVIEIATVKECVKSLHKTIKTANRFEMYCNNFMTYMKKLNKNSILFCQKHKLNNLLSYQCYEVATIAFELNKKHQIKNPNYSLIVKLYLKNKKRSQDSNNPLNLASKEVVMKSTINGYINSIKGE